MKSARQTTLRDHTALFGVGVHSGLPVTLTLHPADAGTGLRFIRTRVEGRRNCEIPADMDAVTATEFATVLGDENGPLVSTAEHVLAALSGLGVDNALVEIDGPEAPIMDGSAAPFVAAIDLVGLETLDLPRRYVRVLKPVRVAMGDAYGEIKPNPRGFRIEAEVEFDHPLIGKQSYAVDVKPDTFRREIARARTFGFMRDVASLWNAGYALGASLENTLGRHRQPHSQPGRHALPRRVRAPQGARCGRRSGARGRALARHLPLGARRPQAQQCGVARADVRCQRLGLGRGRTPLPVRGHADLATVRAAPAFGPDVS